MMGSGKSAVGRALAERLSLAFVDTDTRVEENAGRTVVEIFARDGEPAFRRLEAEAIESQAGRPAVVALGGGAMAQPGAPKRLRASGRVVWLRARPETLAQRVGDAGERPLLAGLDAAARVERLEQLLAEREIHYGQAHAAVDTDGLDVDGVCEAVMAALDGPRGEGAG